MHRQSAGPNEKSRLSKPEAAEQRSNRFVRPRNVRAGLVESTEASRGGRGTLNPQKMVFHDSGGRFSEGGMDHHPISPNLADEKK